MFKALLVIFSIVFSSILFAADDKTKTETENPDPAPISIEGDE
jgi:hypothetical protein